MFHSHLSLPIRRGPCASSPPEDVDPHSQTPSHAHLGPPGYRRSRIISQARPYSPNGFAAFDPGPSYGKENLGFQGAPNLSPICSEDEGSDMFDPADSSTWGVKAPSFLHNGAMLPVSKRQVSRTKAPMGDELRPVYCGSDDADEDGGSLLLSPAASSPRVITPDCELFLKIMDEKLQLGPTKPPSPCAEDPTCRVRSTSSSYPSHGNASTRVQSPDSALHPNRLSLTDLSRFSRANDRLSNLRSSSSLSEPRETSLATKNHEVIVEATTAIAEWQDEFRPRPSSYKQYELAESTEVLPCDSLSQQLSLDMSPCVAKSNRPSDATGLTWESLQAIKGQYDGIHEGHHPDSPDPAVPPPYTPECTRHFHKQSKRKASVFSLRSLTNSLAKRPRLEGLRKWASNVYQQSSRRLGQARQKWRQQAERDRRAFDAWKTRRHRADQGARPKSKCEKEYGRFPLERKACRDEEWWKDGVNRYEAPKWMLFRGSVSRADQ